MEMLFQIDDLAKLRGPLHLAVGVFDGVHLGHRAVIEAAKSSAEEKGGVVVVVTFDPHPGEVLSPQSAPRLLTAPRHKLVVLNRYLGIEHVLVVPFDGVFAEKSGEEFIQDLVRSAPEKGIHRICVGEDWKFGKKRS
ncbi:MAG: adenylyltransferase/cytidyltransferase family protein, partial [Verrucomicrobiota bacterium]